MPKVIISFDFELGWGVLESETWRRREKAGVYERMRTDVPALLAWLKDFQLPTTWAVVSNMLVPDESDLALAHLPPAYQEKVIHFYRTARPQTMQGTDLIEQILRLDGLCEVASHSSSHIYGRYPALGPGPYLEDVRISYPALESLCGRPVRSFVFPRDQADYRQALARDRAGLVMRLNPHLGQTRGAAARMASGLSGFIRPVPVSRVTLGPDGEVYQQGSLNFNAVGGKGKAVKKHLLKARLQSLYRQLERGADSDVFHIWLHPFNLSEEPLNRILFKQLLDKLRALRDRGAVEVMTMAQLAALARPW